MFSTDNYSVTIVRVFDNRPFSYREEYDSGRINMYLIITIVL